MRVALLTLLIGLLLGAFGLRIAQNLGLFVPAATDRVREIGGGEAGQGARPHGGDVDEMARELARRVAEEPAPKDLSTLAVALENAKWDGDWLMVEATALAIRREGAAWVRPAAEAPRAPTGAEPLPGPRADTPLFARARELERGFAMLALESRRNQATKLLGRSDRQAIATLIDLFGGVQQPPSVRADAATALALSGDTQGLEALRTALRSQDEPLRRAAAEALAFIGSRDGAAEMATLLETGPSEAVMIDAARGLGFYDATVMGEPHTATEALLRAVSRHHLATVRKAAVEAFGSTDLGRAGEVRQALTEALRADAARDVRAAAAHAIGGYVSLAGGPADLVTAAAARLTEESDPRVLAELVPVLRFGDAATLAALQAFAGSARARGLDEVLGPTLQALQERVDASR